MAAEQFEQNYNDQLRIFPESEKKKMATQVRFTPEEVDEMTELGLPPYAYAKYKMGHWNEEYRAKYPHVKTDGAIHVQMNPNATAKGTGNKDFYTKSIGLEFENKSLKEKLQNLELALAKQQSGLDGIVEQKYSEKERSKELEDLKKQAAKLELKKEKWKAEAKIQKERVKELEGQTNLLGTAEKLLPQIVNGISARFPAQAEVASNGLAGLLSGGAFNPNDVLKEDEKQFLEFYRALRENVAPVKMKTVFEILNVFIAFPEMIDSVKDALIHIQEEKRAAQAQAPQTQQESKQE